MVDLLRWRSLKVKNSSGTRALWGCRRSAAANASRSGVGVPSTAVMMAPLGMEARLRM
jgi:hypothetical protein